MLTVVLILGSLFFAALATAKFEHSLKEEGSLTRKILVFVRDIVDAFF
jgi:hypothetical protein